MRLTDEKLYELCKEYGARARLWRQKFIGLLPEVNKRRLYERKGFSSIFEFAARLCGLSKEQVYLVLNLERRLEDKPVLKNMLENGEASINKLARVVSIATIENEEELAEKIKLLPISALNTLVRDEKHLQNLVTAQKLEGSGFKNGNGLAKPFFEDKGLYVQTLTADGHGGPGQIPVGSGQSLNFELSADIKEQLNELHFKGFDVNELLRKMLKARQEKIEEEKEEIAQEIRPATSPYISVKIKKILHEEYGTKCSIPTCQKPAATTHHTQRFALSRTHDPRFLAPMCEDHHKIAHSIDIKYHEKRGDFR